MQYFLQLSSTIILMFFDNSSVKWAILGQILRTHKMQILTLIILLFFSLKMLKLK